MPGYDLKEYVKSLYIDPIHTEMELCSLIIACNHCRNNITIK